MMNFISFFLSTRSSITPPYTLSLHDALPISHDFNNVLTAVLGSIELLLLDEPPGRPHRDRKSTRLNSVMTKLVCRLLLEKKKQEIKLCNKSKQLSKISTPLH